VRKSDLYAEAALLIERQAAQLRVLRKRAGLDAYPLNNGSRERDLAPALADAIAKALQNTGNTGPAIPPQAGEVEKSGRDSLEAAILKSLRGASQTTSLPLDHSALMQAALDGLEAGADALRREQIEKTKNTPSDSIRRAVRGSDFGQGGQRR
jgi:hypothetical protein